MTLLELAERCEKARGPDRELDDAIATVLFTGKHRVCIKGLSDEAGGMWVFRHPNGSIGSSLRFTASLDAAMTLVPEGLYFEVATTGLKPGATVCGDSLIGLHGGAYAATPALALTAAALRSRAQQESRP